MEKTFTLSKDPIWYVGSSDYSVVVDFLKEYPHADYNLLIFNNVMKQMTRIACNYDDMAYIITKIASAERSVINSIAVDSGVRCYVVSLNIVRNTIGEGCYEYKDMKFVKI